MVDRIGPAMVTSLTGFILLTIVMPRFSEAITPPRGFSDNGRRASIRQVFEALGEIEYNAEVSAGGELLVIPVETTDRPGGDDSGWAALLEVYSDTSGSVRSYWAGAMGGVGEILPTVLYWVALPDSYAVYRDDPGRLIEHAVTAVGGDVDWERYDWDGDGLAEGIVIAVAGRGGETSGNDEDIWPHARPVTLGDGAPPVGMAAIVPEETKLGVHVHEVGHLLGLPDLYDRTLRSFGLGIWSVMAYGAWAGGGDAPTGLDAWSKTMLGQIATLSDDDSLRLTFPDTGVVRIPLTGADGESFLVSWRSAIGVDSLLPSSGLEILHVNENQRNNDDPSRYFLALEQADGRFDLERGDGAFLGGDGGDLFPGESEALRWDASTVPSSRSSGGGRSGVAIELAVHDSGCVVTGTTVDDGTVEIELVGVHVPIGGRLDRLVAGALCDIELILQNNGDGVSSSWAIQADPESAGLEFVEQEDRVPPLSPGERTTGENSPRLVVRVPTEIGSPGRATLRLADHPYWRAQPESISMNVLPRDTEGWPTSAGDWGVGYPAEGVAGLYVGTHEGDLLIVDHEGEAEHIASLGAAIAESPAIADLDGDGTEELVIITEEGWIHVVTDDGSPLPGWPVSREGAGATGPALVSGDGEQWSVIVAGGGRIWRISDDGLDLPGWPVRIPGGDLTAPCIVPWADTPEISVGSDDGTIHLLNGEGVAVPGWPVSLPDAARASPIIARIPEPVIATVDGSGGIHLLRRNGTPVPGWPAQTGEANVKAFLGAADITGDGVDEIVSALNHTYRVWTAGGGVVEGWPAETGRGIQFPPIIADLDGDRELEIVGGNPRTGLWAWDADGRLLPGFPVITDGLAGAPIVADLDGNRSLELVASDSEGGYHRFAVPGESKPRSTWRAVRGDGKRTGGSVTDIATGVDVAVQIEPDDTGAVHFAGDLLHLAILIQNGGAQPLRGAEVRVGWIGIPKPPEQLTFPIGSLSPGETLRVPLGMVLPFAPSGTAKLFVSVDAAGDDSPANNEARLDIAVSQPGELFRVPSYGVTPQAVSLHESILLRTVYGWILPYDLDAETEIEVAQIPGRHGAAADGGFFYFQGGDLHWFDLHAMSESPIKDAPEPISLIDSDANNLAWFGGACGSGFALHWAGRDDSHVQHMMLESAVVAGPSVSTGRTVFVRQIAHVWRIESLDFGTGEISTVHQSGDSLGLVASADEATVFTVIGPDGTELWKIEDGNDQPHKVVTTSHGIPWVAVSDDLILWSESEPEGEVIRAAHPDGGRSYPIAFIEDLHGRPALSGSVVVWIDAGAPDAVVGMRVSIPDEDIPSGGGEVVPGEVRFRWVGLRENVDHILLEWRIEGDVRSGRFSVYRSPEQVGRGSREERVGGGELGEAGYYWFRDRAISEVGPSEMVRYRIGLDSTSHQFPFLRATIPERPGAIRMEGPYPNPVRGSPRISVELPLRISDQQREVSLDVFDIGGRSVFRKNFGILHPGPHIIEWDRLNGGGKPVGPGVYFMRVKVGDRFTTSRKVIVLDDQ